MKGERPGNSECGRLDDSISIFRMALSCVRDGVISVNKKGFVVFMNPEAVRLWRAMAVSPIQQTQGGKRWLGY
jgi:PAS domain-containing protein